MPVTLGTVLMGSVQVMVPSVDSTLDQVRQDHMYVYTCWCERAIRIVDSGVQTLIAVC